MKYIRLFEQHSEYAAAESGLTLPNVSHCVRENDVHYKNLIGLRIQNEDHIPGLHNRHIEEVINYIFYDYQN